MSDPVKNPPPALAPAVPSLDSQLRTAVGRVMANNEIVAGDIGKVQEIVERKAFQIRAPFIAKVRRLKEAS